MTYLLKLIKLLPVIQLIGILSLIWTIFGPRDYNNVYSGGGWTIGVIVYVLVLIGLIVLHLAIKNKSLLSKTDCHKSISLSLLFSSAGVFYGALLVLSYMNMTMIPQGFIPYGLYIFFSSLMFNLILYKIGSQILGKIAFAFFILYGLSLTFIVIIQLLNM